MKIVLPLFMAAFLLLAQQPDATRGRSLVESTGCLNCHCIRDKGSYMGPELTDIGDRRTPDRLESSIVRKPGSRSKTLPIFIL